MSEKVQYEMSLNDLVSGKLDNAEKHAQKFEGRLGSVHSALGKLGEKALAIGETLGISFAIIKLEEFFSEGIEKAHAFHVAEGQLENTLKNVGERAGLTSEELVSMARKTAKEIPFTTTQIVEMENALSRFGNMSPGVYQKVLAMSADIATALKRDGADVANTLGRIMEAPAENGRLLRQLNVTLTVEQRKYLMMLEKTGQMAKAQTFIFEELATKGYGGAARAAANTDPLFRYNKIMGSLKMEMGNVGIIALQTLAPGLEYVADKVKTGYEYVKTFANYLRTNMAPILKEIKNDAIALGIGVGVAGVAFLIAYPQVIAYTGALIINGVASAALAIATGVLTAAQWALNVAMSANPVGLIVVGIGALITGLVIAYQKSEKFRAVLSGLGEIAKDIGGIFKGLGEMIWGALTFDFGTIKKGFADMASSFNDVGSAFHRGYTQSMDKSHREQAQEDAKQHETTMGKITDKKKPIVGVMSPKSPGAVSKVTGSKVLNINIHIGALIKEMKIQTTNFKDGVSKAQSMVTEALLSAVNDSQLTAGD